MKVTAKRIRAELERIAADNGGMLMPASVVDAARPLSSPLHSRFEWDDSKAAEQHRLLQARQLIAVTVNVISSGGETERVWVSLKTDRYKGGGYRGLVSVLSDADTRDQLLNDALEDMEVFQQKYRHLRELGNVFAAMRRHRKKVAA